MTATDVVDQAGISTAFAAVSADAAKTGADVLSSLGVTVTPVVDTSSISAASRAVEALKASIRGIGRAAASAGAKAATSTPATAAPAIDGARARGGPVNAGGLYLFGERGPELFSPGRSGMIHTAAATRGMVGGDGRGRALFASVKSDAASSGRGSNGGASAPIDASLHVGAVHFAKPEDKAEFEALLRRHSRTVADVVSSETRRASWLAF